MAEVGALHVTLGADTAAFEQGMKRASGAAKDFGRAGKGVEGDLAGLQRSFQSAANATRTLMSALAVGTLGKFALDAVEAVASLGRLSQQTGISVEALSQLKFAAESVGVPFEQLEKSIAAFSQRLGEGLGEATSAVSLSLKQLGISARDSQGNIRGFMDLLPQILDRFSALGEGIGKTQIATGLFGEEGRRLAPLLNLTSGQLEQLMQRAKELGRVYDQEAIKKAQDFQRANVELTGTLQGLIAEITLLATPAIAKAVRAVTGMVAELNKLRSPADTSKESLAGLEVELQGLEQRSETLKKSWMNLLVGTPGWARVQAELVMVEKEIERITAKLSGAAIDPTRTSGSEVFRAAADDQAKMREAIMQARFELESFMAQAGGQRTLLQDLNFAWMSHAEIIAEAQSKIRQAYGETAEAHRMLARTEQQLNVRYQQQVAQTAQAVGKALVDVFPKAKAAAIAQATINTAVAVTEALKLPFPLNWIQAAAVFASGVAQVRAISSATAGGSSSLPSPGGGGGGTPAAPPEPQPSGRSVTIRMEGAQLFTTEQLAEFIKRINNEIQNGATLVASEIV
jgi:hypothetical protein